MATKRPVANAPDHKTSHHDATNVSAKNKARLLHEQNADDKRILGNLNTSLQQTLFKTKGPKQIYGEHAAWMMHLGTSDEAAARHPQTGRSSSDGFLTLKSGNTTNDARLPKIARLNDDK